MSIWHSASGTFASRKDLNVKTRTVILLVTALAVIGLSPVENGVFAQASKAGTTLKKKGNNGLPANVPNAIIQQLTSARAAPTPQPLKIGVKTCGPFGSSKSGGAVNGTEKALNTNKNRIDDAAHPIPLNWDQIANLPASKSSQIVGAPVVVTGYLSHQIKVEDKANGSGGESTNCYWLTDDGVDWHIYLTKQPNQQIQDAVVVETTPRVRPNKKWDKSKLVDCLI
jgi:hypothetical protein